MNIPTDLAPEGLSIVEACRVAGIGRTTLYEAIANGRLKARKLGQRTIILRSDLQCFLRHLPVISPGMGGRASWIQASQPGAVVASLGREPGGPWRGGDGVGRGRPLRKLGGHVAYAVEDIERFEADQRRTLKGSKPDAA